MDDGLRQRIVGAFVLVAIAVVFIPVVFDRERIEPLDRTTQIPVAPDFEPVTIQKPVAPSVVEAAKPGVDMYAPEPENEETRSSADSSGLQKNDSGKNDSEKSGSEKIVQEDSSVASASVSSKSEDKSSAEQVVKTQQQSATSSANSVLTSKGTPQAWVLQIASYRFEGHAKQMRDKLISDGFAAYIRPIQTDRGHMTRLYVGPNLEREKLEAAKAEIDNELGVKSIILKFEP